MTAGSNKCLFLLKEKGKWGIDEHLQPFRPIYNGIGWYLEEKHRGIVEQISQQTGMKFFEYPLNDQSFDQLRRSHKLSYFEEKSIKTKFYIDNLKEKLSLSHHSNKELLNGSLCEDLGSEGKELLESIQEYNRFQSQIEWVKDEEKIANLSLNSISLKFISEIDPDYFSKVPPEKPRLLYLHDNSGIKTTFLNKEIVGMLVAEGGRGKTHLLAQLALCVATGVPFLQEILIEKPGHVCFVVGENNSDDIHRLLFKTQKHIKDLIEENKHRKDGKGFLIHSYDPIAEIPKRLIPFSVHGLNAHFIDKHGERTSFFHAFLKALKEKEPEEGFQLIIFDPASRFAGSEAEKDNAIATAFIACLESISDQLKGRPTILIAHHKSKEGQRATSASQSDARGASGLTDGVRWQAGLSKDPTNEEYSILEITKTNFTKKQGRLVTEKNIDGIHKFKDWKPPEKENTPKDKSSKGYQP